MSKQILPGESFLSMKMLINMNPLSSHSEAAFLRRLYTTTNPAASPLRLWGLDPLENEQLSCHQAISYLFRD